jgi:hypothetical protein
MGCNAQSLEFHFLAGGFTLIRGAEGLADDLNMNFGAGVSA